MTAARRHALTDAARVRSAPRGRDRVRIIGGAWRSRVVHFPGTPGVRPTPDRVRETLFNWLGQRLDGLTCVDLFAGSGVLGFEALSRGAARVVMVERDGATCAALRASARALGAADLEVVQGEALGFLERGTERFDCAFLDPPYASALAEGALERLPRRLREGARVYVESAAPLAPGAPWTKLREGRAGAVRFALYALDSAPGSPP